MDKEIIKKDFSELLSELVKGKDVIDDKSSMKSSDSENNEKDFENKKKDPQIKESIEWFRRCIVKNEVDGFSASIFKLQETFLNLRDELEDKEDTENQKFLEEQKRSFRDQVYKITQAWGNEYYPKRIRSYKEKERISSSLENLFENVNRKNALEKEIEQEKEGLKEPNISLCVFTIIAVLGSFAWNSFSVDKVSTILGNIVLACGVIAGGFVIKQFIEHSKKSNKVDKLQENLNKVLEKINYFPKEIDKYIHKINYYRYLSNRKFSYYADKIEWAKNNFVSLENHQLVNFSYFFEEENLYTFRYFEDENTLVMENEKKVQLESLIDNMLTEQILK